MNRTLRTVLMITAVASLAGCGVFKGGKPKTPVLGNRVPVLVSESGVEVDPAIADVAIVLPPPAVNPDWTQPGGNASKSMGHLQLSTSPSQVWSTSITGGTSRTRLAASPVVADGKLYVIDTMARVHAYNAQTGAELWTAQVGSPADVAGGTSFWSGEMTGNTGLLYGGGVSVEDDRVYATSGLGDVAAMNVADGSVVWKKRPGGPLRGAPTLSGGNVYVVTQDNQLFALRGTDGNIEWSESGTLETAGIFGVAAPAAAQGTVVAGFSSGELNAYRYENGRAVWQDALSRTSISTSVSALSDIDADPVIDQGRVYSVGKGGRMVALELVTGQRLWEINVAGISTPWAAGEWLFVVTDEGKLLCVARATGKVRWVANLGRWHNEKKKKGPINWTGPILAGGQLILANSRGDITYVSPTTGAVERTVEAKGSFYLPPIVADNMMFTLSSEGRLTAWR